jgi:inner membrane protein
MTAPTHIAFSLAAALIAGADKSQLGLIAAGSLLPDIDHPQSALGRIFFFISYPFNKWFGHRGLLHSLVVWVPFTLLGYLWQPFFLLGAGAISHCVIDCLNVSGVQLMHPITEKVFVLASRKYRIKTGTGPEFVLLVIFGAIGWGGGYMGTMGGLKAMLQYVIGSYEMAVNTYLQQGTKVCRLTGRLRFPDGTEKEGEWLIIGPEGTGQQVPVAVYDERERRIIHIPENADPLKVRLKVDDKKRWQAGTLRGLHQIEKGTAFCNPFETPKRWVVTQPGDVVTGYVLYQGELRLRELK